MNNVVTRGLAVSAVSALTLTGLSLAAVPAAHAAAPSVRLLSQQSGFASVKQDEDYSTSASQAVRLTARATIGATVVFQLNADPEATDGASGWQDLPVTVTTTGRYSSATWTGEVAGGGYAVGERVAIRAKATDAGGTSYSGRRNVEVVGEESTVDGLNLDASSTTGYFVQPYADSGRTKTLIPVRGTTSADRGTVKLTSWRDSSGTFVGQVSAQVEPEVHKAPSSSGFVNGGRFQGVLDITGFSAAADSVPVSARGTSDDVAILPLAPQTIASVSASAPAPVRDGETGVVEIQVRDSGSNGVVGAEVRRLSDSKLIGYTDVNGTVRARQSPGPVQQYYANATDADAYASADGDQRSSNVTVDTYTPAATNAGAVSYDGTLFDVDEYAAGDVGVVVTDQQGRAMTAGTSVDYKLYRTGGPVPAAYSTATTNSKGLAAVPFSRASGDWTLVAHLTGSSDPDTTVEFTAGQARLVLNPSANPAPAAIGGEIDYVGRLTLDGKPLPGRRIDLTFKRGVEVVPGNTADAGLLVGGKRVLATKVFTNGNGSIRFTVDDASEATKATETGGVVTAATGATAATEDNTLDGNAKAKDTSTTRFGNGGPGKAKVVLGGTGNGAGKDVLTVTGPTTLAGERVQVLRFAAGGKRVLVTTKKLGSTGDLRSLAVADTNGAESTTYVVRLVASKRVQASDSNTKTLG